MRLIRQHLPLSRIIIIMAVAALVMGSVFVYQGVTKAQWMTEAMRTEQVTLGLDQNGTSGNVVDTAGEAQVAGDTIREHRRQIAATYDELLDGQRFDPTDPAQLTYAQAMNMENYLYLAVLGFGLTQVVIASGAFMILTGVALAATSIAVRRKQP